MSYNSSVYDKEYYSSHCGECYERGNGWEEIFARHAERIIKEINPKTVLDVGCAAGYLVEGLRDRGVDAEGIDISEYAISLVREDIKPYCMVKSATEKIDKKYDLITCIEVLEHMTPEDFSVAIDNMCEAADVIIFSSTPFDYNEESHISVNPTSFWAEKFAYNGFYHDISYDCSYIAVQAMLFRKIKRTNIELIRDYENKIFVLWQENCILRDNVNLANARIGDLDRGNIEHAREMEESRQKNIKLEQDLDRMRASLDLANARIGDLDRGNIEHAQEMGELRAELDLANARIGDLDRGNIEHAQEMGELRAELDLANARIGDLDRGNIEHARMMEVVNTEHARMMEVANTEHARMMEVANTKVKELKEKNAEANERIESLDRSNNEYKIKLEETQAKLKNVNVDLERKENKYKSSLSREYEKRDKLENKIIFFREKIDFLESELFASKKEVERQNCEIGTLVLEKNIADGLRSELENLERINKDYQTKINRMNDDNQRLNNDNQRLNNDNQRLNDDNQRLNNDNQRLNDDNQRLNNNNQRLFMELKKLKYEVKDFKNSRFSIWGYRLSQKWKKIKNKFGKYSYRTLLRKGIDYWKPVFNAKDYCKYNPDIVEVTGNDEKALLKHFVYYGINERRRASSNFDIDAYCFYNPDVEDRFGNNSKGIYLHYIENGMQEKRVAVRS